MKLFSVFSLRFPSEIFNCRALSLYKRITNVQLGSCGNKQRKGMLRNSKFRPFFKLIVLIQLFQPHILPNVSAHPVSSVGEQSKCIQAEVQPLNFILEPQDKICSLNYNSNDASYRRLFEQFTGIVLPSSVAKFNKKIYSGFKLHRTYHFYHRFFKVSNQLKMSYCHQGKVQWETEESFDIDIEWNKPICFYGGTNYPLNRPHPPSTMAKIRSMFKNSTVQAEAETLKQLAIKDIKNFNCFKIARRKKYVNRNVSIYFPNSWVGGIFYCDLSDVKKRDILNTMNNNLQFENSVSQSQCMNACHRRNSVPLQPLISDNYLNHWTEYKENSKIPILKKIFKLDMNKIIPYLYTPNSSPSDSNFTTLHSTSFNSSSLNDWNKSWKEQFTDGLSTLFDSNKVGKSLWYSEIEVMEDYHFTQGDISKIRSIVDKTLNQITALFNLPSTASFVPCTLEHDSNCKQNIRNKVSIRVSKALHSWKNSKYKLWKKFSFNDRALFLSGSDAFESKIEELKPEWDHLNITNENFVYSESTKQTL